MEVRAHYLVGSVTTVSLLLVFYGTGRGSEIGFFTRHQLFERFFIRDGFNRSIVRSDQDGLQCSKRGIVSPLMTAEEEAGRSGRVRERFQEQLSTLERACSKYSQRSGRLQTSVFSMEPKTR